jgi:hypothetical protein
MRIARLSIIIFGDWVLPRERAFIPLIFLVPLLAASCADPVGEQELAASCVPAIQADIRAKRMVGDIARDPAKVCSCAARRLIRNKEVTQDALRAYLSMFKAHGRNETEKALRISAKMGFAKFSNFSKALVVCRAEVRRSKPTTITTRACEPWIRRRVKKLDRGDAQAAQGKAGPICACIVQTLYKPGALKSADGAALNTYFTVFGNPVKRDPAYGHISQDGRKTLHTAARQCAERQGVDLK